jgi:Tol biopolymer transport system component
LLRRASGNGPEDLFAARRNGGGALFLPGVPLLGLNTDDGEGTPFLAADDQRIYFYSDRAGGPGNRDLWVADFDGATLQASNPTPVAGINATTSDSHPWVSPDELRIVFDSRRPGGSGNGDVWEATRSDRASPFDAPVPLRELNTSSDDEGPGLTRDGLTIFFASARPGGAGFLDVWVASRASTGSPFSTPVNLEILNGESDDLDIGVVGDGHELFFSSERNDGQPQLYRALRQCP